MKRTKRSVIHPSSAFALLSAATTGLAIWLGLGEPGSIAALVWAGVMYLCAWNYVNLPVSDFGDG